MPATKARGFGPGLFACLFRASPHGASMPLEPTDTTTAHSQPSAFAADNPSATATTIIQDQWLTEEKPRPPSSKQLTSLSGHICSTPKSSLLDGSSTVDTCSFDLLAGPSSYGDVSEDTDGSSRWITSLSPLQLQQELGKLSYLGQGAYGVVYQGTLQSGQPVAVKLMLSNTPQQLWQRAKEGLLSKLVNHPNLVNTVALDVSQITEQTCAEWSQLPGSLSDEPENTADSGCHPRDYSLPNLPSSTTFGSCSSHDLDTSGSPTQRFSSGGVMMATQQLQHSRKGPVPFREALYHLDAAPGKYMTRVIMEVCDGGTLQQAINRGEFQGAMLAEAQEPTSESLQKLKVLVQSALEIVMGMQHLHALNIVHGDLKPGNVLLSSTSAVNKNACKWFTCKVSDFGLATTLGSREQTITGETWGTVAYMAPEVVDGKCRKASDVYAFGIILWQMVTGQLPYAGMPAGQVLLGVKAGELQLLWPVWMHKSLLKVGQACLRHDPKERPGFKGIASALRKIVAKLEDEPQFRPPSRLQNSSDKGSR